MIQNNAKATAPIIADITDIAVKIGDTTIKVVNLPVKINAIDIFNQAIANTEKLIEAQPVLANNTEGGYPHDEQWPVIGIKFKMIQLRIDEIIRRAIQLEDPVLLVNLAELGYLQRGYHYTHAESDAAIKQ